jgi:hypothetical protein
MRSCEKEQLQIGIGSLAEEELWVHKAGDLRNNEQEQACTESEHYT